MPKATRTAEIERRQTRRQCARQRLNTRISDLVGCKPPAAESQPYTNAQCAYWPSLRRSAATSSDPTMMHHPRPPPHRMLGPRATAERPRPNILLRLSVVRLGGSLRASASTLAAPIRLAASHEQPSLNHDPSAQCAHWPPPTRSAATSSEASTPRHMRPPPQRMPSSRGTAEQHRPHVLLR